MSIVQRIASRALVGLWAQKQVVVVGAAIIAALAGYVLFVAPPESSQAGGSSGGRDCADTVMAALSSSGMVGTQQQAYQCMDSTFQQQVSQQQFTSRLQASTAGRTITHVARVGTTTRRAGPSWSITPSTLAVRASASSSMSAVTARCSTSSSRCAASGVFAPTIPPAPLRGA